MQIDALNNIDRKKLPNEKILKTGMPIEGINKIRLIVEVPFIDVIKLLIFIGELKNGCY